MNRILSISILLLAFSIQVKAQIGGYKQPEGNRFYISGGFDPAVLIDKNRVGGGNLNGMIRAGIDFPFIKGEGFAFNVSGFYERFDEIYFQAFGLNVGVSKNWRGYEVLGKSLNRWTTSVSFEQGFITRNGIVGNLDIANFKSEDFKPYYVGFNLSFRYDLTTWLSVEYIIQHRQRPDKDYFYNQTGNETTSGFIMARITLN